MTQINSGRGHLLRPFFIYFYNETSCWLLKSRSKSINRSRRFMTNVIFPNFICFACLLAFFSAACIFNALAWLIWFN